MTKNFHIVIESFHNMTESSKVTETSHNITEIYHNVTHRDAVWEDSSKERAISLLIIGVIIILANTLTLIVAHKLVKQGRKLTNFFIFALAWTDLLVAILILPISIAGHFGMFVDDKHNIICKISFLITNTLTHMSVLLIAAMSVERYMAFVHPLVHQVKLTLRKAKWTVIVICASCVIVSILPVVGIGELDNNGYVCMIRWDSESLTGKIVTLLTAGTAIALIVIVWILNSLVIYHLNVKQSKISSHCLSRKMNKLEIETIRFTQITILLAFAFSVCWMPYCIRTIMVQCGYPRQKFVDFIVIRLAACNSMLNPIIYGALKVSYRRGYLYLVKLSIHYILCRQTKRPNEGSFLHYGTRTSSSYNQKVSSQGQNSRATLKKEGMGSQPAQVPVDSTIPDTTLTEFTQ